MQERLREYREDLNNEKAKRDHKRNLEISIMTESKTLHQNNKILRTKVEQHEIKREYPKYLIEREIEEQELVRKRSLDRRNLDANYKQTIEISKK